VVRRVIYRPSQSSRAREQWTDLCLEQAAYVRKGSGMGCILSMENKMVLWHEKTGMSCMWDDDERPKCVPWPGVGQFEGRIVKRAAVWSGGWLCMTALYWMEQSIGAAISAVHAFLFRRLRPRARRWRWGDGVAVCRVCQACLHEIHDRRSLLLSGLQPLEAPLWRS
jgi:hypothetical protein